VTGSDRVSDAPAPLASDSASTDTSAAGSSAPVTAPAETTIAPPAPPTAEPDGEGPKRTGRRTRRVVIEWVLLIGGALLIAFLIKTFLFQAFYIPSESMTPTLQVGDRVLVNKLSYRLHDVNRGDIVVFEAPEGQGTSAVKDLVKRVIGLPGERVEFGDGDVFIDGELLEEPYLADGETTAPSNAAFSDRCEPPAEDNVCVVPADSVLVLGDNRNESKDGRVFGPIDESDIVGRVFVRIWPIGDIGFL
jgi:signal peptidase I